MLFRSFIHRLADSNFFKLHFRCDVFAINENLCGRNVFWFDFPSTSLGILYGDSCSLLVAVHDFYQKPFGVYHRRVGLRSALGSAARALAKQLRFKSRPAQFFDSVVGNCDVTSNVIAVRERHRRNLFRTSSIFFEVKPALHNDDFAGIDLAKPIPKFHSHNFSI